MQVKILGSGTSTGVPVLGRDGPVNHSTDPRDKRLRSSILIEDDVTFIVDTGPDFRAQMLENNTHHLDAVLYTHFHYDHIGGLDDLRPLTYLHEDGLTIHCDKTTFDYIYQRYDYIKADSQYKIKPKLKFDVLNKDENGIYKPFRIGKTKIQPIEALHVPELNISSVGYIFNDTFLYLTDFKELRAGYEELLKTVKIAILGCPLPHEHPSHISMDQAVELMNKWNIEQGYLTHLSDKKTHRQLAKELPSYISPAYDGLVIKF
ncbi:MAG: MBL fold metallo-hydrolase [Leptospirales bacterium]